MKTSTVVRISTLPLGLLIKLWSLAKEGARDINNQIQYKGAKIDSGCCINELSTIAPNVHLLNNCVINNSQISSYSYIGKNCTIQNTSIGKFCSIANDVFIGLGKHPTDLISTSTLFYRTKNTLGIKLIDKDSDFKEYDRIRIGHDVWIGARALIMDGIVIGHGAIIAANSVVTKNVPSYAIVAGVPARIIKYRFQEDKIEKMLKSEWWNWTLTEIRQKMHKLNNL